jgi:hypothetical protein
MSGFFLNTFSSSYVRFLVSGIFLLAIALFFNYRATQFAATHAGPPVEDIILDHIPVVNPVEDWPLFEQASGLEQAS